MHLKNFAMLHGLNSLTLTPHYDIVAAALHQYKTLALSIADIKDLRIDRIKPKHIIKLAQAFKLSDDVVHLIIKELQQNRQAAFDSVFDSEVGEPELKDQLIQLVEKRWNGTFSLIGK